MSTTNQPAPETVMSASEWVDDANPTVEQKAAFEAWLDEQTGIRGTANEIVAFAFDRGLLWCRMLIFIPTGAVFDRSGFPVEVVPVPGSVEFWRAWPLRSELPPDVTELIAGVLADRQIEAAS